MADTPRRSSAWGDGSEIPRLQPVSVAVKSDCLQRLQLALSAERMDEVACAVCDRSRLRKASRVVDVSNTARLRQLRELLSSDGEALPAALIAEYDCSNLNSALRGVLLSKRGVRSNGDLHICQECDDSLAKRSIPKYAIKNGFYVGSLPSCFSDMTLPERLMTQTVSVVAVTRVIRGGAHRAIRSHCLAFDATPGPAATLLPIPVGSVSSYRVVLAGPFTTDQHARVRQMHRVRRHVVDDVLRFYRRHNVLYERVAIDCSDLPADAVAENLIVVDADAGLDAADMDAEHDRVGSVSENDASACETDVVERRVVFISDDREVSTQDATVVARHPTQNASQPQFLVRHSTQFARHDEALFACMFPHLFPYGRGHPGERRHVAVGFEACIRYYGLLSSRKFAEDELFMLASFDHLSLQKMYTQVALKCKRSPAMFEPYSDITEDALMQALRDKELRRQGRTTLTRGERSSASAFLKTVELSGSAMWGTDAERAQCRRRAFAYQTRFGQPALFVTLTPNIADTFVMAKYCGIVSVDTLFDAPLVEPPGRSALHSACMRNDVVSARLFTRNIDAFIEHVLGVAPQHMRSRPFDGLFGDVKAYFGMVETQGGGTLHAHFLVWLADAPPNSDAFARALAAHGDQYYQDIAAFADSVVSTSMPLSVADSSCVFCGHSYADLQPLPIPPEAYEDPNKQRGRARGEPALVRCLGCSKDLSSQHVIRRLLLQNRPAVWPPPMRPYSSTELAAAVRMEVPCRGSVAAAKAAVYRRDMHLWVANATDENDDTYGEYLRSLNLAPNRLERREDDAFRDDVVARALVLLPPSVDDERWAPRAVAFAVSILVFMLNLHWWSHAGSCFKKSRASSRGQCRYGFPRARIAQTFCSSDGVALERRAPFEFINGFNREMMLAFRSNHDIQVMIGGANALLRIYYATKYVTKMQEQIDSITAVALAAFKRRQQREVRDDEATSSERAAIGRRRVASLLFAITNRREIAGPLASLYVLRGSCAYMSAPCATLPLRNVLQELVDQAAQSCDLVELREHGSDTVTFRAASFLDDYLFRPQALSELSLYEFVAKHFRRKRMPTTAETALFQSDHPLFDTHCVGTHTYDVVPVVAGRRMPFVDDESPHELVVQRCQCALVLFKPFRAVTDLVADPTSSAGWADAFSQWQPTRTCFTREIMANMDDYSRAAKQARESSETTGAELDATVDCDGDTDDLTGTRDDIDAAINAVASCEPANAFTAGADAFYHILEDAGDVGSDSETDDANDESNAVESSLPVFPNSGASAPSGGYQDLLGAVAQSTVGTCANLRSRTSTTLDLSLDELQRFVKDTSIDEVEPHRSERFQNERPTEVIALLAGALESDRAWSPPQARPRDVPPRPLPSYALIVEVSLAFTLNQRQHAAFALITSALLRRFLRQELGGLQGGDGGSYCTGNFEARIQDDLLLMFLGGAGGTGKSRVIDAVDAFCASWHRDDAVVKAALTGKAATLIGGRTLASFTMRLKYAIREKHFAPLDLLVIDEVSMMSKAEWLRLDKLLRHYKQVPGVPFGGVHMVLVGDFLQMPPVKADPIYLDPVDKTRKVTTADIEGFELWRKITTVVVLEESVRFRRDPEWGEGCRLARLGQWTRAFIDLINSRVLVRQQQHHQQQQQDDHLRPPADAVFVTPENVTRLAVNNAFVAETAIMLPPYVFPVRVLANFKGALNGLSRSDVKYILSLPDNRFGRMAPYLDLILGMPVQVTQNVATAKGVANGTLGILESVHFPDGTRFRLVRDGVTNTVVQLPSRSPDYAMLRLPQRPRAVAIRPELDPELFPVFFATEAYQKVTITLPKAPDGRSRSITVKPQQLPFVCAVGSTVYKVQGETLQSMVVMDWRSKQRVVNKPQQTYLLVSRVTSRHALVALTPFTNELAAWSKPPASALNEEERLRHLSDVTLEAFQQSLAADEASTAT
jgi:hypothetical protein